MEAVIGAAFDAGGIESAFKTCKTLTVRVPYVDSWTQMANVSSKWRGTRRDATLLTFTLHAISATQKTRLDDRLLCSAKRESPEDSRDHQVQVQQRGAALSSFGAFFRPLSFPRSRRMLTSTFLSRFRRSLVRITSTSSDSSSSEIPSSIFVRLSFSLARFRLSFRCRPSFSSLPF